MMQEACQPDTLTYFINKYSVIAYIYPHTSPPESL